MISLFFPFLQGFPAFRHGHVSIRPTSCMLEEDLHVQYVKQNFELSYVEHGGTTIQASVSHNQSMYLAASHHRSVGVSPDKTSLEKYQVRQFEKVKCRSAPILQTTSPNSPRCLTNCTMYSPRAAASGPGRKDFPTALLMSVGWRWRMLSRRELPS